MKAIFISNSYDSEKILKEIFKTETLEIYRLNGVAPSLSELSKFKDLQTFQKVVIVHENIDKCRKTFLKKLGEIYLQPQR